MKRLLITTWGDYSSWSKASYVFNSKEKESVSTLPILFDELKPDKVVIIIPESVIYEKFSSYDDLIQKVKEGCSNFISEKLGISGEITIIVSPIVGNFIIKKNGKSLFYLQIDRDTKDFYNFILYNISKILSNILADLKDKSEVYLDISHGINFLPTLTYQVLIELLSLIAYTKSISFYVYNSEPYSRDIPELKLHINEIERREKMEPYLSSNPLGKSGNCRLLKVRDKDENLSKIISEISTIRIYNEQNAFISSIVNGLPLVFYTFYPNHEEISNKLSCVVDKWKETHDLITNGQKFMVKSRLSFTEDFKIFVKIWFASIIFGLQRNAEAELKKIKEFINFVKHDGLKYNLLSRTLGMDLEQIKDKCGYEWKKLGELITKTVGDFDPQNFLAHAGLEYNVTEARKEDYKIKLRYDMNYIKNIIYACIEGLFR